MLEVTEKKDKMICTFCEEFPLRQANKYKDTTNNSRLVSKKKMTSCGEKHSPGMVAERWGTMCINGGFCFRFVCFRLLWLRLYFRRKLLQLEVACLNGVKSTLI